ncbi:MAG: copper amine oxidase N-terminal domain-containing protein [Defluviitaleaceae bacterium]|nr:copper amine oxidase N-terminal domain-containing protein [Defluviitaleaceae bacterium]
MKRKIALLLVLAMILSLVPANLIVSANTPGTVSTPISAPTGTDANDPGAEYAITINAGLVWSQLVAGEDVRIELILRGGNDTNLRFLPAAGAAATFNATFHNAGTPVGTFTNPTNAATLAALTAEELVIWESIRRGRTHVLTQEGLDLFDYEYEDAGGTVPPTGYGLFSDVAGLAAATIAVGTPPAFAVTAPATGMTQAQADLTNAQIAFHNVDAGWDIWVATPTRTTNVHSTSTAPDEVGPWGHLTFEVNNTPSAPTATWWGPLNATAAVPVMPWDGVINDLIEMEMFVQNHQRAVIILSAPAGLSPQAVGSITIPLPFPIRVNQPTNKLYAYLNNVGSAHVLAEGYLTSFGQTGIDITYGDPVVFEWDANLGAITIQERVVGGLVPLGGTEQVTFRLVAPPNYSWSTRAAGNVLTPGAHADYRLNLYGPLGIITASGTVVDSIDSTTAFVNQQGREELIIRTTLTRSTNSLVAGGLGSIQIRRLQLVPQDNAPLQGDVNVEVRVGHSGPANQIWISGGLTPRGINIPTWEAFDGNYNLRNLLVARRVTAALTLSVLGDDLPEFRSGYAWNLNNVGPNVVEDIPNAPDWPTTGRTATLRIQENVVNALDLARGRPITFEVPEGFIFTGVQYVYNTGTGTPTDAQFAGTANMDNGNGGTFHRPAPGQPQHVDAVFTDNTVTLRFPVTGHDDVAFRNSPIRLDVRFFISVEGGSASRGLDEVEVTVTGTGVSRLNPDANTAVVANVYDPVVIEHIGDIAQVNFIGHEQNINHTPAGALTITETEGGMLQFGTRLWVGVAERYGIGFGLGISRHDVLTDATTGLGLTVRNINPTAGNVTWIQLEVTRESLPGNPGTITLDGLTLFGHVYQGERYFLIVTGPAIAENHIWVQTAQNPVHSIANPPVGVFNTFPYALEIVEAVAASTEDYRANSLDGVRFDSARTFDGAPEMIWERLPGMTHEAGLVSARLFAEAAGVTNDNITWSAGVATISGWDYQGQWVTVILTQNSTTATIIRGNGSPGTVDIAEFAEGLSGPAGTLAPVFRNNRIYLPFRFLFNVFGYSADYNLARVGTAAVISAR